MAIIDITASGTGNTIVRASAYLDEYFWCRTGSIQKYLDTESTIQIGDESGDTFDELTAIRLENDVVDEIIEYLDMAFYLSTETKVRYLITQASKLTAARIATSRFAGTMTLEIAEFIRRLENQAWAGLMRSFLRGTIRGLTSKSTTYKERLIHYKTREQGVINPDV